MYDRIIICSNIAGAGKSIAARYLTLNYAFQELSFANKIYEIAEDLFGMIKKDRYLLQQIGEKMREIDNDVWVNYTFKRANKLIYQNTPVVISDMRRINEYNKAIEERFLPIKIICDEDKAVERIKKRDGYCDTSLLNVQGEIEKELLEKPMIELDNNGSINDLFSQMKEIIM